MFARFDFAVGGRQNFYAKYEAGSLFKILLL